MMKKELNEKYNSLKAEYLKIKEQLENPEFAKDADLHKQKKIIKKEMKSIRAQYNNIK